jgi:hypothetical protein
MKPLFILLLLLVSAVAPGTSLADPGAVPRLVPLARIGPWPVLSGLTAYRGRIWFANAVKYKDHNSADVYSFDPATGKTRYERHLFSQDVGRPAEAFGLLYWPFEDSRTSMGAAEYMVTNGSAWQWRRIPTGLAFHNHVMLADGGDLYAGTGAFHARLHHSTDRGRTWRQIYVSEDKRNSFSRVLALATLEGALYLGLYSSNQPNQKLLMRVGQGFRPVPGWPVGDQTDDLVTWRGHVYGLNTEKNQRTLWRTNGKATQEVAALSGLFVVALAGGPRRLWALVNHRRGGASVWSSADGISWREGQGFAKDRPVDLLVHDGRIYAGGRGADGKGVLWGTQVSQTKVSQTQALLTHVSPTRVPVRTNPASVVPDLPPFPPPRPARLDPLLAALDDALADPAGLGARGSLRRLVDPLVATRDRQAGGELSRRLGRLKAGPDRSFFAGGRTFAAKKANWVLLWGMARLASGRVPLDLLAAPWREKLNSGEKYAAAPPLAAWVAGLSGQNDQKTIGVLIDRLGRKHDPLWLKGDMIGALTALTGKRFGYDLMAWQRWWAKQRTRK